MSTAELAACACLLSFLAGAVVAVSIKTIHWMFVFHRQVRLLNATVTFKPGAGVWIERQCVRIVDCDFELDCNYALVVDQRGSETGMALPPHGDGLSGFTDARCNDVEIRGSRFFGKNQDAVDQLDRLDFRADLADAMVEDLRGDLARHRAVLDVIQAKVALPPDLAAKVKELA